MIRIASRIASLTILALAIPACALVSAIPARASQWTDDQVDFARHGFRNGAWDCYGRCSGRHRHRIARRSSYR